MFVRLHLDCGQWLIDSYFMRPISETLFDAKGSVLNRAWINYDGGQGYTYSPASTNLVFSSGPVYLRDFGLGYVLPFQGGMTLGHTTRVQAGDDSYVTTEYYQYDAIGNVTIVTDTRGFAATAQYDQSGNYLLTTTNALGPEFAIQNSSTALNRINTVNTMVFSTVIAPEATVIGGTGTSLDMSTLQALAPNPSAMVDKLDQLLLHRTMSAQMKSAIVAAVNVIPASDTLSRARTAAYLFVTSAQYQVQR